MRAGRQMLACFRLTQELDSVAVCLRWFRDELPALVLLVIAPGLLGIESKDKWGNIVPYGSRLIQEEKLNLSDTKSYLQAPATSERFMRKWAEEQPKQYPHAPAWVPLEVAKARTAIAIPNDPGPLFPRGDIRHEMLGFNNGSTPVSEEIEAMKDKGRMIVSAGKKEISCFQSVFNFSNVHHWKHVVSWLEQRECELAHAIGECMGGAAEAT
jgi:hypothetical protein